LPFTFHITCLCLCPFYFDHLSHILGLYILFDCLCFICGLRTLKHLITTKTLKNICWTVWIWSELLDLELGNIPCAKGLAQCQDLRLSYLWHAFIWCKTLDLFDWSATLYLCLIVILLLLSMFDVLFWVDQRIFHLLHGKTLKTVSYWNACLDIMDIFIWCLDLHMMLEYCSFLIAYCLSKSKGKWISIWHYCMLDCIPLVRSFQLLTFNCMLRISLFISSHFLNFKSLPLFKNFLYLWFQN
jgi:hypothetical protein